MFKARSIELNESLDVFIGWNSKIAFYQPKWSSFGELENDEKPNYHLVKSTQKVR